MVAANSRKYYEKEAQERKEEGRRRGGGDRKSAAYKTACASIDAQAIANVYPLMEGKEYQRFKTGVMKDGKADNPR